MAGYQVIGTLSSTFFTDNAMNRNFNINVDFSGPWDVAIFATIIFLVLRLTKLIAWSWWWVFSPVLAVLGLWLVVALVLVIVSVIFSRR